MRKLFVFLGIASVASLLAYGWLRQDAVDDLEYAQKNFHLTVLAGKQNSYILTPPEFVAQPFIRHIQWSPDGNYAILVQTAMRFEGEAKTLQAEMRHRLLAWSRKTKRISMLWESQKTNVDIDLREDVRLVFFKDGSACVFAVREDKKDEKWGVYHATIGGRTVKLGEFERPMLLAPPEDNVCYLIWSHYNQEAQRATYTYTPIETTGRIGETRPLPPVVVEMALYLFAGSGVNFSFWYADGKQLIVPVLEPLVSDEGVEVDESSNQRYFLWNPRTNQAREIQNAQLGSYAKKSPNAPVVYAEKSAQRLHHNGAQATTQTTWLSEGSEATLVAVDSAIASVAPNGDAILYVAHGAAFYRSLIHLTGDDLRRMREAAKIARYCSQGKQIGLAFLMYLQDYDEILPPSFGNERVAEIISVYLPDKEVFSIDGTFAFRYLMDGQSLADIELPANTEIGYLETPEGRVVIYVDGHVQWKPNH